MSTKTFSVDQKVFIVTKGNSAIVAKIVDVFEESCNCYYGFMAHQLSNIPNNRIFLTRKEALLFSISKKLEQANQQKMDVERRIKKLEEQKVMFESFEDEAWERAEK